MALYNEILVGRINRFLQNHFGLKGGPPAPQLASEVSVQLGIFSGVENRFVEGWTKWFVRGTPAAGGAGNSSALRIRNPATSNVIAVIEKATVANNTGATQLFLLGLGPVAPDLTTVISTAPADGRQNAVGASLVASQTTAIVGGATNMLVANTNVGTNYDFVLYENQEIIIPPGFAADLVSITQNVAMLASFVWRERALEEGERR